MRAICLKSSRFKMRLPYLTAPLFFYAALESSVATFFMRNASFGFISQATARCFPVQSLTQAVSGYYTANSYQKLECEC